VPYRGSVPALLDVIAGHIPFMVVDLQPALPPIREGKVRALGVTTQQRVIAAPDLPTFAESGLPGFELVAWQGVVVPAGTPRAIIDELVREIGKLFADPATRERFAAVAIEPIAGSTPGQFRRLYQGRSRPLGRDCPAWNWNDQAILIAGTGPPAVVGGMHRMFRADGKPHCLLSRMRRGLDSPRGEVESPDVAECGSILDAQRRAIQVFRFQSAQDRHFL
jgi:hypothetical protein